jgi:hypothetical protein
MSEHGKDEELRRDDDGYEERESDVDDDSDLPVEPARPAEDPDPDEVPPGTEPGAET